MTGRLLRYLICILPLTCLFASAGYAQNVPKVIAQRATTALEERAKHPELSMDRCSLKVVVSDNLYVQATQGSTADLRRGDRLLSVDGQKLGASYLTYLQVIARFPPSTAVKVSVDRNGQIVDVPVTCENVKKYADSWETILVAAAKKDWRACTSAIRDYEAITGGPSADSLSLYLECGFHAGEFDRDQTPRVAYQFWRQKIDEGQWDPIAWPATKGEVLGVLTFFESAGQPRLAADLQRQVDEVDARLRDVAPSAIAGGSPPTDRAAGSGTGFLVDPNGMVLTSAHVVADANGISVKCTDRPEVSALVASSSKSTDLALLTTSLKNTNYLSLVRPRSVAVGQRVFTYGFPVAEILGSEPKYTDGSVSALSGLGGEQAYLQISVPVQPGNSGGPVVAENGEVVGVLAAAAAVAPFLRNTGTLPQNVNWAVKAEYAALMFDGPSPLPPASSRSDAIKRVQRALCYIEVR